MTKKNTKKDPVIGLLLPVITLTALLTLSNLVWAQDILGDSGGNAEDKAYKRGGTLLFSCCGGTLGALVGDGNSEYILSNKHVLELGTAAQGNLNGPADSIIAPSLIDSNQLCEADPGSQIATLTRSIVISETDTNRVDAAIAITSPGAVSPDIKDIGAINGVYSDPTTSLLNTAVMKRGRTTGLTYGVVDMVNASVSVKYGEECGSKKGFVANFDNQIYVIGADFSAGGDSGSVVLTTQPDTDGSGIIESDEAGVEAVGLLFAGNDSGTFLNPINEVLSQLQVSLVTGTNTNILTAESSSGGGGGGPPQGKGPPGSRGGAAFGLTHANAVKDAHASDLMLLPNVVAVGVGVDENGEAVIKVHLESAAVSPSVPIPTEIEGIPVLTRVTGPVVAY